MCVGVQIRSVATLRARLEVQARDDAYLACAQDRITRRSKLPYCRDSVAVHMQSVCVCVCV